VAGKIDGDGLVHLGWLLEVVFGMPDN